MTWSEMLHGVRTVKLTGRIPLAGVTLNGKQMTAGAALIQMGYIELNPTNDQTVRLTARGRAFDDQRIRAAAVHDASLQALAHALTLLEMGRRQ